MRFSVVINTFNRAASLPDTLRGLSRQSHDEFEVVVVNGPSTDGTADVLAEWSDYLRVVDLDAAHLGRSRNKGIAASAGEVVAFIDDDAIPEPDWLEGLAAGFDDPLVAGVGGLVFDHTGLELQYRYSVCGRTGHPRFDVFPPFDEYLYPGADPFLYLQGTNCSFRREALVEIGGFDETIEYYLDETEVCMRLVDAGYRLVQLDGAAVHHRFLPSHLRATRTVWTNPYPAVKNRHYFALSNVVESNRGAVLVDLADWVRSVLVNGSNELREHGADDGAVELFVDRVHRGVADGIELGLRAERRSVEIGPPPSVEFRRFPTVRPEGPTRRFCFVSGEYPPDVGGIGRFTEETASGLAALGHEVHVVTRSDDVPRIDVENDVWVHRVHVGDPYIPGLETSVLRHNFLHAAALYGEVVRLHQRRPLNLVSAPIWNCENLLCSLDGRFPTVTTLHTTIDKVVELLPTWEENPHVRALRRLEAESLRLSPILHANSRATSSDARRFTDGKIELVHFGLRDVSEDVVPLREAGEGLELLFVGRMERRKGVDILLDAIPALLERLPELHVTLVGRDTPNTELGMTYREHFEEQHRGASFLERVHFVGEVSGDELARRYAGCDVFCAPSRYESFGFVLLEAMAHGRPVVACSSGGVTDIVDGNGELVAPGDSTALFEALLRMLTDPQRREEMGDRSRRLFEEYWELSIAIRRIEQAYVSFADSGPTGDWLSPSVLAPVLVGAGVEAASAESVASELLDPSNQPRNRTGELVRLLVSDDASLVEGVYRLLRDRSPEQWEREVQLAHLAKGGNRLDLVDGVAADPWHHSLLGPGWRLEVAPRWDQALADAVRWFIADPDDGVFVSRLYETVLFRQADPHEVQSNVAALRAGTTRAELLWLVVGSDEARAKGIPDEWPERLLGHDRPAEGEATRGARTPVDIASLGRRVSRVVSTVRRASRTPHQLATLQTGVVGIERQVRDVREVVAQLAESTHVGSETDDVNALFGRYAEVDRLVAARLHELRSQQERGFDQLADWLNVLQRKQEAMALDMRERLPASPDLLAVPEPRVLAPGGWAALVDGRRGSIRLNLGCGEKPKTGYINVDARPLEQVDVVADVRRLPVPAGTADEIDSEHLVEHFRLHELETVILPYWRSLLRPGGRLRIVCPDGAALIDAVANDALSFEQFRTAMFGLQDYSGDDHFTVLDATSLTGILERVGFTDIDVVAVARRNVGTFEMELTAVNPGDPL